MNNKRRDKIKRVILTLEEAKNNVYSVLSDEEYSLGNMPENLEYSEMYAKSEEAVESLDDSITSIEDAIKSLEDAMQ